MTSYLFVSKIRNQWSFKVLYNHIITIRVENLTFENNIPRGMNWKFFDCITIIFGSGVIKLCNSTRSILRWGDKGHKSKPKNNKNTIICAPRLSTWISDAPGARLLLTGKASQEYYHYYTGRIKIRRHTYPQHWNASQYHWSNPQSILQMMDPNTHCWIQLGLLKILELSLGIKISSIDIHLKTKQLQEMYLQTQQPTLTYQK